ncbi:MAG: M15 family metallopeptidase [Gemmatimonadota bacterium]
MDTAHLTGETERHLCTSEQASRFGSRIHADVVEPFLHLQADAARAGFDLQILSGFRSFQDQLSIWNQKAQGGRPVLDSQARPVDIATLTQEELVFAILRWSALPGASRHHWGTDLDVFDAAARPAGYEVELVPEEVDPGGMFGPLHDWLDGRMAVGEAFTFFRPYDRDRDGVAPERWHLSCGAVADGYQSKLTREVLEETIENSNMDLKKVVLEHLDEIFRRFVLNVGRPPI